MYENTFDERLKEELLLPFENRLSRMTDEEIIALLERHEQEQKDYDALEQERDRKKQEMQRNSQK